MILKIDSSVLELKGEIRSWSLLIFKGLNKNDVSLLNWTQLNPFTPKNDQHVISPYTIIPELNIKVMKIKKMITN